MITPGDAHARLTSSDARMYETTSAPAPPSSSGTYTPMNPRAASSARIAGGTWPCSSMSWAIGSSFSVANSRAVRWTSCCVSVSSRSKAASGSVVVVVAVLLIRMDADEPPVRIAREEVVALEVPDDGLRGPRPLEGTAHVVHAEPHDEAGLLADLRRRLAVVRRMEHDVRVLGLEPG